MKNIFFVSIILVIWMSSCDKKSNQTISCSNTIDSFTVFPLNMADISSIIPLGNLNPPAHTFPTDHCYLSLANPNTKVPIYAPGNMTLIQISRARRSVSGVQTGQDFDLDFCIGNDYYLRFGHVSELSTEINNLITSAMDNNCQNYATGGIYYSHCSMNVSYSISAGQVIGKAGGQSNVSALDMGLYKPTIGLRDAAVCPFVLYKNTQWQNIQTKFGNYNFSVLRTIEPKCGEIFVDVPNTAKGIWLKQGQPFYPEDYHIAFVNDNVNPTIPAISVGTSQTGLNAGVYSSNVLNTGFIDRSFSNISSDGNIYCLNLKNYGGTIIGSLLLKMTNTKTIDVEYRNNCDCSCNLPYALGANKVTYVKP